MSENTVTVRLASLAEAPIVKGMLYDYLGELAIIAGAASEATEEYPYFEAYWLEAGRHPFLILSDAAPVGIALVRGPESTGTSGYEIAEFFVEPDSRRSGLGCQAIREIWRELPGDWTLQTLVSNRPAVAFWSSCVGQFAEGQVTSTEVEEQGIPWVQIEFSVGASS